MPNVERECITHHYACDCREKVLQDYIKAVEAKDSCMDEHRVEHCFDCKEKDGCSKCIAYWSEWLKLKTLKH